MTEELEQPSRTSQGRRDCRTDPSPLRRLSRTWRCSPRTIPVAARSIEPRSNTLVDFVQRRNQPWSFSVAGKQIVLDGIPLEEKNAGRKLARSWATFMSTTFTSKRT